MNFNKKNFYKSLINIGIKKGQNLFIHSDIGLLKEYKNKKEIVLTCKIIVKQLLKVVGKNGSLAFPTFSYSFTKSERYFPKISKSICGHLSEYVKNMKSSSSYNDPNVSVVVLGKKKDFLTKNFTNNAYGANSFFDRFYKLNGHKCNINLDSGSTFLHLFEKKLNVKYRIDKTLYGFVRNNKKKLVAKYMLLKKIKLLWSILKSFIILPKNIIKLVILAEVL